ncbi:hypothetical protein ACS0PU_001239 [Formica fusca]
MGKRLFLPLGLLAFVAAGRENVECVVYETRGRECMYARRELSTSTRAGRAYTSRIPVAHRAMCAIKVAAHRVALGQSMMSIDFSTFLRNQEASLRGEEP